MRKYLRRAAAIGCAVGLLLSGCSRKTQKDYTVVHPERGAIENWVEDTGVVSYRDPFSVIPLVSGKILSCAIAEGDLVEEGAVLYEIDSTELENQITQAQMALNRAEETYRQAQAAAKDLTVTSKVSGAVTVLHVHVGDFVSMGTPIADVVDSVHLTVTMPFAKEDARQLAPGAAATITFAAYGESLPGTVKRVHETTVALPGGREGVNVEFSFVNPGTLTSGTIAMATVNGVSAMDGGPVDYATAQSIFSTQTGQVASLPIQVGDAVKAGQAVMTIKNDSLTNGVSNAKLGRDSASVNLQQLVDKRKDFKILAPVAGTVSVRNVKEGDFASTGTPMAVIVQEASMCIHVPIDEIYIERVRVGQKAQVSFTTDTGEQWTYGAAVSKVADSGVTAGGVTDYTVELTLENTDLLKAGMNVSVAILTEQKENCLRVPERAVKNGKVQILQAGKPVETDVETGISGGGFVEILSGLTEEDEVIVP